MSLDVNNPFTYYHCVYFQECAKCKKDIHQNDLMINAPALGSEANWHPGCFECSVCNELLADLIFCHKDGNIYCVRHFGDQLKPRCCMCDEVCKLTSYLNPLTAKPLCKKSVFAGVNSNFEMRLLAIDSS